jgi:hypothetical protein
MKSVDVNNTDKDAAAIASLAHARHLALLTNGCQQLTVVEHEASNIIHTLDRAGVQRLTQKSCGIYHNNALFIEGNATTYIKDGYDSSACMIGWRKKLTSCSIFTTTRC